MSEFPFGGFSPESRPRAASSRRVVATWDIQACRALRQHRFTMVLHLVARQEVLSIKAFHQFASMPAPRSFHAAEDLRGRRHDATRSPSTKHKA